jgi:hypothetical protein
MQRCVESTLYILKGAVYIGSYGLLYVFKVGSKIIIIIFKASQAVIYLVCISVPRMIIKYTLLCSGGYFVLKLFDVAKAIAYIAGLRSAVRAKALDL